MTFAVVTTFSPEGYEVYGRRFIDTFVKYWPSDVLLHVFYEGEKPADASNAVQWHALYLDKDRAKFMAEHKDEKPGDYRKCPVRFSHKVFAVTRAPRDTDGPPDIP